MYEAVNAATQQRSEYDFITNSVEFTQQTTSSLSESDINIITNT